jgi:hypothetical protein
MNAMAPASAPPAPNAPEPAPKEAGGIFDKMGPVVIGLTAALYACGYTVVLTAAERLGISDPGSGIFKGKYIQVGAYCIGFILTIAAASYVASSTRDEPQPPTNPPKWSRLRILNPFMLLTALLAQSFLVWPDSSSWILLLAMIGYFVIALVAGLLKWQPKPVIGPIITIILPVLLFVILISCFAIHFPKYSKGRGHFLISLPPPIPHEILALIFLISLCLFLGRMVYVLRHHLIYDDRNNRLFWCALMLPLLVFGTYDAVISFAVVVYPYIPCEKGGGDYGSVSEAFFYGSKDKPLPLPCGPLVVLLETDDCYYVAKDPCDRIRMEWGKIGGLTEPNPIYHIPRTNVERVKYVPRPSFPEQVRSGKFLGERE